LEPASEGFPSLIYAQCRNPDDGAWLLQRSLHSTVHLRPKRVFIFSRNQCSSSAEIGVQIRAKYAQAAITRSPGAYYSLTVDNAAKTFDYDCSQYGDENAVDLAAWATAVPSGLDPTAPQVLPIGLLQNASALSFNILYGTPQHLTWLPAAANYGHFTAHAYNQQSVTTSIPPALDDVQPGILNSQLETNAPLYTSATVIPYGCTGGSTLTDVDSPGITDQGSVLLGVQVFHTGQSH